MQKGWKKLAVVFLALLFAMVVMTSCDDSQAKYEVGGTEIVRGKDAQVIRGTEGVWEVPGKYRLTVYGVYYNDYDMDYVDDLTDPSGNVVMSPKTHLILDYTMENLGLENVKDGFVEDSKLFDIFMINNGKDANGDDINFFVFPYEDDDYEYDGTAFNGWQLEDLPEGTEGYLFEIVSASKVNPETDVLVFTASFKDGDEVHEAIFEIKFSSLAKIMEEPQSF